MFVEKPIQPMAARLAARFAVVLLAPGARLLSVRLCAPRQGVSPSKVLWRMASCWRRNW